MRTFRIFETKALALAAGLLAAATTSAGTSAPSVGAANTHAGRASVYAGLQDSSLEAVSTSDRILSITQGSTAPTEIWRTLEHGERVECLECVGSVARLLYDGNAKTREISAWWLRRRIFGVFGAGQVYSQVLDSLVHGTTPERRAYAAEAVGEFLVGTGVAPVAHAAVADESVLVRRSAVRALDRLNDQGPNGELGTAIGDASPEVRLAALEAAVHINVFTAMDAVVGRLSDDSADVRRRAAEVLGTLRAGDAVVSLMALTAPEQESDARVRAAAVSALGRIGDSAAHDAVNAATADPDSLVRSVASIALRRL